MAQGADNGRCASDSGSSSSNNLLTEVSNYIYEAGSNITVDELLMSPLYVSHEGNIVNNFCENGASDSQNCEQFASPSITENGICPKDSHCQQPISEGGTSSTHSPAQGQEGDRGAEINNFVENSPSTSGLKGILKHRQRRKSEGNITNPSSRSTQSGPEVLGKRPTLVSIARRSGSNCSDVTGGDPTRRESVPCLCNNDFTDHSLSVDHWATVPSCEPVSGLASTFDVAATNRNVEFELSEDEGGEAVTSNGHCDCVTASPPVVVTVGENGNTAGDGVVKVPIRTKKGILKKRSKSTESLPKRNSIRFSDYEDEIIIHNQEEPTIQNDQALSGSSCLLWNRQRKASLQESYSNRSLDTQSISDHLKSILKTSNSKGRESLPSSSEELCGILKRTCLNDSEGGGPFSMSSDAGGHLKMKGILKTQISSEDSSRYSSMEDVDSCALERAQSAPAENNRFNANSSHLAVNAGYTHPTLTNSTQLKGILRVDSGKKTSSETPLVSVIVSPMGSENMLPSLVSYESNRDSGSSLYSSVENSSSSCYSRSDSCGSQGSRPQSCVKEIKVRSILKNSNRSVNGKEKPQNTPFSHSSTMSKSLTFNPGNTNGLSNGISKSRISFPENGDFFGEFGKPNTNGVVTNADFVLDSYLHQSSCISGSSLQQPVKSILRTSCTGTHSSAIVPFVHSSMHVPSEATATSFASKPTGDPTSPHDNIDGAITTSQINSIEPQNLNLQLDSQVLPHINALSMDKNEDTTNFATDCNRNAFENLNVTKADASNLEHRRNLDIYRDRFKDEDSVSFLPSVDPDESYDEDEKS